MSEGPGQPTSARLRRTVRSCGNVAAFVLFFAVTALLLGSIAPLPKLPTISDKWAYFREHGDEYNAIFVGSSRVYRQVIPPRFDATMAQAGRPMKSFNFGQDGAFPPEGFFVLRKILGLPLPKLRWVFIELMNIKVRPQGQNEDAAQSLYWHDWHHTQLSVQEIRHANFAPFTRLALLWREYRLWFQKTVNLGSGTPLLEPLWSDGQRDDPPQWIDQAGHHAGRRNGLSGAARDEYLRLRAEAEKARSTPMSPHLAAELESLAAAVRKVGAEPIFVVSPTVNRNENFSSIPGGATLLTFNHPDRYPELYAPENYYDAAHLNPKGAALYTDRLARAFLEATTSSRTR